MRHLFSNALATALPVRRGNSSPSPQPVSTFKRLRSSFTARSLCILSGLIFITCSAAFANNIVSRNSANWSASSSWIRTMTGTITVSNNATAVVGVGTLFLTELSNGSVLWLPDGTAIGTVLSIADNTHLTLSANNSGAKSGASYGKEAVPQVGDDVVISNGFAIVLDVNATVGSLSVIAPGANGTSQLSIGAFTLNVSGNGSIAGGSIALRNSKILFTNAAGILDVAGAFSIGTGAGGVASGTAVLDLSNGTNLAASLKVGTVLSQDPADGSFVPGTASTVFFDGSAAQTIDVTNIAYANIRTVNSAGVTFGAAVTASNVTGNITVGSGILNTNNLAVAMAASKVLTVLAGATMNAGTSVITMGASGSVVLNGTFTTTNLNGFYGAANTAIANSPTLTLTGSSVQYTASGAGQKVTASGVAYINVALSGGSKIIGTAAAQTLNISGNFAIGAATSFSANNTVLNVTGNVTGTGAVTPGTGLFTIAGTWSNSGTFPAGANFAFTSASSTAIPAALTYGTLALAGPKTLAGDVTSTSVSLSGSAKISLGARTLSVASVSGGDASNYIITDGAGMLRMTSVAAAAKLFPVGPSVSSYAPVTVTPSTGSQNWSVRVQPNFSGYSGTLNSAAALQLIWMVNTSAGNTTTSTGLLFQYNETATGWSSPLTVDVYHFDANGIGWAFGWQKIASNVTPSGSAGGIRTVSVSGQTMFSPFAIQNPAFVLPVNLESFTGKRDGSMAILNWRTLQESGNKGFDIQRSVNGRDFETIAFVNSKAPDGNSSMPLNYSYSDKEAGSLNVYYRLLQQDINGKSIFSSVVQLKGTGRQMKISGIYVQGSGNKGSVWMNVNGGKYSLVVSDLNGNKINQQDMTLPGGDNKVEINLVNMSKGVYFITLVDMQTGESVNNRFVK
jgi:hypothetical protein